MKELWTEITFGEILNISFIIFFRYCVFVGATLITLIAIARITSPRSLAILAKLKEKIQQKAFQRVFFTINVLIGGICGAVIDGNQTNLFVSTIAGIISGGFSFIVIYSIIRFLHEYLQNENEQDLK